MPIRLRTKRQKAVGIVLTIALLTFVLRDRIACVVGCRVASFVAQTSVQIDDVAIGWGTIEVSGLRVFEPDGSQHVLLEVPRTMVQTSLWRGIRHGIWLNTIAVRDPQIRLRIDEQGQLLSVFPPLPPSEDQQDSARITIPLSELTLSGAALVVDQAGDRHTLVGDVAVQAHLNEQINVRVQIGQVLAGRVKLQSTLDAATLGGTTKLSVRDVLLHSDEWPLSIGDLKSKLQDTLQAHLTADAVITHPPHQLDWRQFPAQLQIVVDGIQSRRLAAEPMSLVVRAASTGQRLTANVHADPLGSRATAWVSVDTSASPIRCDANWQLADTSLDAILQAIVPDVKTRIATRCNGKATLLWQDGQVDIQADNTLVASQLDIDNLSFADVQTTAMVEGTFSTKSFAFSSGVLQGNVRSNGIQLSDAATALNTTPDVQQTIGGRISGDAEFSLPLNRITDVRAIEAVARVAVDDVRAMGLVVESTSLTCQLTDGRLTAVLPTSEIHSTSGQPVGTFASRTDIDDITTGTLAFEFVTDGLSVEQLTAAAGVVDRGFDGTIDAELTAVAPVAQVADATRWSCRGELRSRGLRVADETVDDVSIVAELDGGRFSVPPTQLIWRSNRCRIQSSGFVGERLDVQGQFDAQGIRLDDISAVASRLSHTPLPLRGQIDIRGEFSLSEKQNQLSGTAVVRDAHYAATNVGRMDLAWSVQPSGLTVETSSNAFLGGRYRVAAAVNQLDWTQSTIDAEFQDVQASRLASIGRLPVSIQGTLEGHGRFTSLADLKQLRGQFQMQGSGLLVNDVPIELSLLEVDVENSIATLRVDGGLLRGNIQSTFQADLPRSIELLSEAGDTTTLLATVPELPVTGTAQLSGVSFESAVAAVKQRQTLRPLSGKFDLTLTRDDSDRAEHRVARIEASTENIRWNQARLSDRILASVSVFPDRLDLRSLDGRVAEGRLTGKGQLAIQSRLAGYLQVSIDRMNLRRLAGPLGPAASQYSGSASVKIDSRIQQTITGSTSVAVSHAKLAGINVRGVRMPVDWTYSLNTNTATWRCRSGRIDVGNGWVDLSTDGTYRNGANMKLSADVRHVDTSRLLAGSSVGAGVLDGRVNLRAKHARSLNQLVGDFEFDLTKVEAMSIPVLDQIPTLMQIDPRGSLSQNNVGYVRGRMAGGMVHLDRVTVSQSDVLVTMNGNATLDGRLNFDVTAATGQNSPTEGLTSLANSPLMLAAPAPAALLIRANEALKDRVVHAHIGGSASRPTVRIQPGKQLTQDALRFFLSSQFGTSVADAADTVRDARTRR